MKQETQIKRILETKILVKQVQITTGDKKTLAGIMAKHLVEIQPSSKRAIGGVINGMMSTYSKRVVPLMDVAGNDFWKEKIKEQLEEIKKKKPPKGVTLKRK